MLINKGYFTLDELVKFEDYKIFLKNVSHFFDNTIKKQAVHDTQFEYI